MQCRRIFAQLRIDCRITPGKVSLLPVDNHTPPIWVWYFLFCMVKMLDVILLRNYQISKLLILPGYFFAPLHFTKWEVGTNWYQRTQILIYEGNVGVMHAHGGSTETIDWKKGGKMWHLNMTWQLRIMFRAFFTLAVSVALVVLAYISYQGKH